MLCEKYSHMFTHAHEWINVANDNVKNISQFKGFYNCTLMNEWRFWDGYSHVSRGWVSSNKMNIPKRIPMND